MDNSGRLHAWLQSQPQIGQSIAIEAIGRFAPFQVVTVWQPERQPPSSEVQHAIDLAWTARLIEARQAGRVLFPGPLCRLDRAAVSAGRLELMLSLTDYREFVGTNLSRAVGGTSSEFPWLANPLGLSVVVETIDRQIVLVRRSHRVAEWPGALHVIGGHLEPTDRDMAGRLDPFAAARREFAEETGRNPQTLETLVCLGIGRVRDTDKPELVFSGFLNGALAPNDLIDRNGDNSEHDALSPIPANGPAVLDFLETRAVDCAPAARLALVLWAFQNSKVSS